MKFCHNMLNETVQLILDDKLPYTDSIIIGDNASGKSEVLRQYLKQTSRCVYFIDAVNRNFNIEKISTLPERIEYKQSILIKRLLDENFNLKDTWSYYGTETECIELLYGNYEKCLQELFKEFTGSGFSIYRKETQEVKYDFGEIGKISTGYQAIVRIILELLYFQDAKIVKESERAVVVIDEIDEYLSAKNARAFYLFLKEKFPYFDFIVTTHSADIIAAASKCNILVLQNSGLEILDAGDFKDIDDAISIFKKVFGKSTSSSVDERYDEILRKLLNNRISGIWGENEKELYDSIKETELTKAQKVLYYEIGEW